MIITSTKELIKYFPVHSIDSIDPFLGVIDNSEHDFLKEKLGAPLYEAVVKYHNGGTHEEEGYYSTLLEICQRTVAYDAMARAIGMNIVDINNSGVNIATADDYQKVDLEAVRTFKQTCVQEAHSSVNRLLQTLEQWCRDVDSLSVSDSEPETGGSDGADTGGRDASSELEEITRLWSRSRFYYLAAQLLIPSAQVLQDYINIYENRERFVQLLPDLRFIQDEIIEPAIGTDLLEYFIKYAVTSRLPDTSNADLAAARSILGSSATAEQLEELVRCYTPDEPTANVILRRLRKVMAALLVERTSVLKFTKEQKMQAHGDAVRMMETALAYIGNHQQHLSLSAICSSPVFTSPAPSTAKMPADTCNASDQSVTQIDTYHKGDAAAWTPPIL